MATLQIEPDFPQITLEQRLAGWRLELCIELHGEGTARIFARAVEESSFKATELRRGVLFHRLDTRFKDLGGCVDFVRPDLERLVDGARRVHPSQDNLFAVVVFDKNAWEQVQQGWDRWMRR